MILALYGGSKAGKTTIARHLSLSCGLPVRYCGEEVKRVAEAAGLRLQELGDGAHRAIDAETRAWVSARAWCIVEGRYLDFVLGPLHPILRLVKLWAPVDTRMARQGRDGSGKPPPGGIEGADRDDNLFQERMFGELKPLRPDLLVDTSRITIEECTCLLAAVAHLQGSPPG